MTASHGLDGLGVHGGETVLVHGAGSTVGYAAVQMAIHRGARVIATAGKTYAAALRAAGAEVTDYGDGMVERVIDIAGGPVDLALDAAPISDALPSLVNTVKAPENVLTLSDLSAAERLGVRIRRGRPAELRHARRLRSLRRAPVRCRRPHLPGRLAPLPGSANPETRLRDQLGRLKMLPNNQCTLVGFRARSSRGGACRAGGCRRRRSLYEREDRLGPTKLNRVDASCN
jgi:hypothetical protein